MKNMKKILTVCMLIAMLSSLMMLTSCFGGGVEEAIDEILNAQSYTIVTDNSSYTMTIKVNQETKTVYYCEEEDGDKEEEYYWFDEQTGKYYYAELENGTVVEKKELTLAEFIDSYGELAASNSMVASYKVTLDLWTENEDGSMSYTTENKTSIATTTVTVKLYIAEDDSYVMERVRDYKVASTTTTTKTKTTVSRIDETEIVIPQSVLSAVVK